MMLRGCANKTANLLRTFHVARDRPVPLDKVYEELNDLHQVCETYKANIKSNSLRSDDLPEGSQQRRHLANEIANLAWLLRDQTSLMRELVSIVEQRTQSQQDNLDLLRAKESKRRTCGARTNEFIALSDEIAHINARIWNVESWRQFKRIEEQLVADKQNQE